jgi:hypothetical protein
MSDPVISMLQVPMREAITLAMNDPLTIAFTEDCCFCCDPDQVNNFIPALPMGDQKSGTIWVGVAVKAGTINFSHEAYGTKLSEEHGHGLKSGSRSIQVGN